MFQAQVSSKGQVVIPKVLRDRWGIDEGAVIAFVEDAQGLRLTVQPKPTDDSVRQSLDAGLGLAATPGQSRSPAPSPAEMRADVRAAFKRKPI